jgi:hypothetical protein
MTIHRATEKNVLASGNTPRTGAASKRCRSRPSTGTTPDGDDGCPRACLIWDPVKIAFRAVRDGLRKICPV